MIAGSSICRGMVTHERLHPVSHAFTYPSTFFAFDLSELDTIAAQVSIFSHNGKNLLSLNDPRRATSVMPSTQSTSICAWLKLSYLALSPK